MGGSSTATDSEGEDVGKASGAAPGERRTDLSDPATLEDGYQVAVAAGNPETIEQLTRTAADLARHENGSVLVVSVAVQPRDSPFALMRDEIIKRDLSAHRRAVLDRAVAVADETGVEVDARMVVAPSVADGILDVIAEEKPDLVLLGWSGRSPTDAVLGTNLDRIVTRSRCDVLVEKLGPGIETVESILLPVVESPHTWLASQVAAAIADANDAEIELLHVVEQGHEDDAASDLLAEVATAIGSETVRTRIESDRSPVETIVAATDRHDLTIMGATRAGPLQRRLVGSTPRTVGRQVDKTVIIARRPGESPRRLPFPRIPWP